MAEPEKKGGIFNRKNSNAVNTISASTSSKQSELRETSQNRRVVLAEIVEKIAKKHTDEVADAANNQKEDTSASAAMESQGVFARIRDRALARNNAKVSDFIVKI